jgi:DNA polymerase III subunit epsilon
MPTLLDRPLAFVDLETTGATATRDRVTEVAVITWNGVESTTWSQLLNPETRIPPFIESLTGISNEMVENAPRFAEIAEDLAARLAGHIVVAHNVRFDYAFLKNEFRQVGIDFRAPVLCTVKYSRKLFPEFPKHNLDSVIARHGLSVGSRHRALADTQAIFDFWRKMDDLFPVDHLNAIRKSLLSRPSLPPNIDAEQVDNIPDQHGVYLFYGENDLPIYVGKANQLKQRVLSHFSADHAQAKELNISQQVRRIEWQACAGEVDALITEARLIKHLQPTLNRQLRRNRDFCSWTLRDEGHGNLKPALVYARDLDFGKQSQLYGLFKSGKDAREALLAITKEKELCTVTLGLEKGAAGKPCFARQLKRCRGACSGDESLLQHSLRLMDALGKLRLKAWPFEGPAVLAEGNSLHVIDAWCHLGTAQSEADIAALLTAGKPVFDRDTYRILIKHLDRMQPLAA